MIEQLNVAGLNKIEVAINRLKTFEPPEGYYLAFSGGKDSIVVKELCNMAGVKLETEIENIKEVISMLEMFAAYLKEKRLSKDIRDVMMQNLKDKLKELNEELKTI